MDDRPTILLDYINKNYPLSKFDGAIGLLGDHASRIGYIVANTERIPVESLAVSEQDKMDYEHALESMRSARRRWEHDPRADFDNRDGSIHPINILRGVLTKHLQQREIRPTTVNKIKAFIGYSSKDKKLAGALKGSLERFGLEVFLAHHTITPSKEWKEEMFQALSNCTVFLPLLTDNFPESKWTDQESGIAYALKKIILPIDGGQKPYGFLEKFQSGSEKLTGPEKADGAAFEIIKSLLNYPELIPQLRGDVIHALGTSNSFYQINRCIKLLAAFDLEPHEMELIIQHWMRNDQIYNFSRAREPLIKLISAKKKLLSPNALKLFEQAVQKRPVQVFGA